MKNVLIIFTLIGSLFAGNISSSIVLKQINVEEITDVDVIVNPANGWLQHGGGIAGALSKRAGPELQQESNRIIESRANRAITVSSVVITDSYQLSDQGIKKIFHAIGPDCRNTEEKSDRVNLLTQTYANIFKALNMFNALKKEKLKSIALPSISTGIFAYPDMNEAVDIAVHFIKKAFEDGISIIIFANDRPTLEFYSTALKREKIPHQAAWKIDPIV